MNASARPTVLTEIGDGLGIITLNRPDKLNALDPGMVAAVGAAMRAWRYEPRVRAVVLRGAGDRGFSAGGDLSRMRRLLNDGRLEEFLDILAAEFELAAFVSSYPKPVIAYMDGVCMGAGLGIAGQASVRIVTPDSRLAMPETRIGYVPDVGGSLLLGRAPGHVGEHLAATGDAVGAGDAVDIGWADFCIEAERFDDVLASASDLAQLPAEDLAAGLEVMHGTRPPAQSHTLAAPLEQGWIDRAYAAAELPEILHLLRDSPWPLAREAAARIEANSPLAVSTAIEVVRASRDDDELRGALEREHRAAAFLLERPDAVEGIRALIVDKDRSPRWSPADPADVDLQEIADVLEPEDEAGW